MTTDQGYASPCLCPQCQKPVETLAVVCPACGVDLVWAAALAERQVLASLLAMSDALYQGDIPLLRFGEHLLQCGYITEAQLSTALTRQREAASRGTRQTLGQTLVEMGAVTGEQLDIASIAQIRQLRAALQAANRNLDDGMADFSRALQQAQQQLSALNELESNLVSNLAHSLRSPVVPIRGYSSMMSEGHLGPLTDQQREAMEIVLRCVNQLETAISAMGQFAAILKGQVRINPTQTSVVELVERLRRFFGPPAEAARINLRLDVAEGLPPLSVDAEKVWWALFQLFEYPLKLMAAGDELALSVSSAAGGKVRFAVRDMAPGLPPARCQEILDLPSESIAVMTDGRSWSLAQVKRIVEAHGARFAIESLPERGTLVWFELPVEFAPWP